jgi:hypothetical protein
VITRSEHFERLAFACLRDGPYRTVKRLGQGQHGSMRVFFANKVSCCSSEYVAKTDGQSIGRAMWLEGKRPAGVVVGEYVGNTTTEAAFKLTHSMYGVELDKKLVKDCVLYANKPVCIASMCNDARGVVHRTSGAAARRNCQIVTFSQHPGRVFIVTTRATEDEEGFVCYGKKYGTMKRRNAGKK